jgi:hypothetical protein
MTDQPTVKWLRTQAYTVLAELMTSDDDRIALRAATVVITSLRQEAAREEETHKKERRIVVRYGNGDSPAGRTPWAASNPEQRGAIPGSGLRAAVGQDRDGEDRRA